MKVHGGITCRKGLGSTSLHQGRYMKVCGRRGRDLGKATISSLEVVCMKGSGGMICKRDTESRTFQAERNSRASGLRVRGMDMG